MLLHYLLSLFQRHSTLHKLPHHSSSQLFGNAIFQFHIQETLIATCEVIHACTTKNREVLINLIT